MINVFVKLWYDHVSQTTTTQMVKKKLGFVMWINPSSQNTQIDLFLPTGFSDVHGYVEVQRRGKMVQTDDVSAFQGKHHRLASQF